MGNFSYSLTLILILFILPVFLIPVDRHRAKEEPANGKAHNVQVVKRILIIFLSHIT